MHFSSSILVLVALGVSQQAYETVAFAPSPASKYSSTVVFNSAEKFSDVAVREGEQLQVQEQVRGQQMRRLQGPRAYNSAPLQLYRPPGTVNGYPNGSMPPNGGPGMAGGPPPLGQERLRTNSFYPNMNPNTVSSMNTPIGGRSPVLLSDRFNSINQSNKYLTGGSRTGWASEPLSRRKEVVLETDGRPLEANYQLWEGPNNTPQSMRVYSMDGRRNPFRAIVETPNHFRSGSTSDVRNTGPMEFPLMASVASSLDQAPTPGGNQLSYRTLTEPSFLSGGTTLDGGVLRTFSFDQSVGSVQVSIVSEGMPINAIVELWQGPGDARQVAEIYTDNGVNRPFNAVIETPGHGSTVAVRNSGPTAYPIRVSVQPYSMQTMNEYNSGYGGPEGSSFFHNNNPFSTNGMLGGGGGRGNFGGARW